MSRYKIYWKHTDNGKNQRGNSVCTIDEKLGEECLTLSEGMSIKHPKDPFDRHIGISESFKKAVAKIPNKKVRKEIWDDFLSHRKLKNSIK